MSLILANLFTFVLAYKYVGFFVICFFSSVGLPLPSVGLLLGSAALASQGNLNFWIIVFLYAVASVLGDIVLYWLAKKMRHRIFSWRWFKKHLTLERVERTTVFLTRHPIETIVWSRFIGIMTTAVDLLLGVVDYSFPKFLVLDVIGQIITTIVYALIGYVFGDNWIYIEPILQKLGIIVVIVIGIFLIWRFFLRTKTKK